MTAERALAALAQYVDFDSEPKTTQLKVTGHLQIKNTKRSLKINGDTVQCLVTEAGEQAIVIDVKGNGTSKIKIDDCIKYSIRDNKTFFAKTNDKNRIDPTRFLEGDAFQIN
jgi:predicted lipoprotein